MEVGERIGATYTEVLDRCSEWELEMYAARWTIEGREQKAKDDQQKLKLKGHR